MTQNGDRGRGGDHALADSASSRLARRAVGGTGPHRGRLLYVMGASGSGKDSVMGWVAAALRPEDPVMIAHRYVTRSGSPGEASIELPAPEYARRVAFGIFALHWRSHGLGYGIGIEIEAWLARGLTVLVNGSREYLAEAHGRYPQLEAVEIVVSTDVLRGRLLRRGRESAAGIDARLLRAPQSFSIPEHCRVTRLANDAALACAGAALLAVALSPSPHTGF